MSIYINSALLGARNKRILLLKMFSISEYVQVEFIERTPNAIPCLSRIYIHALTNILIPTNAQVLIIHFYLCFINTPTCFDVLISF
jgi:hypothetical protein